MATYKAIHEYAGTGQGQLSFKKGDLFTLQEKFGNGWLNVKKGKVVGLVPESYVKLMADEGTASDSDAVGSVFVVLYDFTAKEAYQLSVKAAEKVCLVNKHTKEWWSVSNRSGKSGLVPSSYVKKSDEENSQPQPQPQKEDKKVTSEVILSIDRAIEKIHKDAASAGGQYTAQQRATLQQLVDHRQKTVNGETGNGLDNHSGGGNDVSSIDSYSVSSGTTHTLQAGTSRRKAPPPPGNNSNKVESLDLAGVPKREKTTTTQDHSQGRPKSDIFAVRSAPPPPTRHESLGSKSQLKKSSGIEEKSTKPPFDITAGTTGTGTGIAGTGTVGTANEDNVSLSSDSSGVGGGGISPDTKRRINSYLNRAGSGLESVKEDKIELPTEFSTELGVELIDVVRERTGISHGKSAIAVEGILSHIGEKVPIISQVMDGLLEALRKSQVDESAAVADSNKDLIRLKEIFFEIQEARDDSQQRGWAIRDDSGALASFLEELLQLLYDSDPDISRAAVQEDKYENVLVLISYYQLEHRVPLRILLLKIFGALFTLDEQVISVVLQSVLPNELGHGIQQKIDDTEKIVWSSVVCTMMFSTAEQLPFSVYDQWNNEFVHFLLDNIESPPDTDLDDEIPDVFLNTILSFNQHFEDPSTNIVMRVLKENANPRVFSEKLMLLVNRGEDPVAIKAPCCPDSLTKILLDLFADKETATIFYTSDLMVLIDIITRQLHDLCPGEKLRSHYLELLRRLLASTDYSDHKHRQQDLTACLKRITNEEEAESKPDQEAVRQIWHEFPGVLQQQDDSPPPQPSTD